MSERAPHGVVTEVALRFEARLRAYNQSEGAERDVRELNAARERLDFLDREIARLDALDAEEPVCWFFERGRLQAFYFDHDHALRVLEEYGSGTLTPLFRRPTPNQPTGSQP